MPVLQGDEIVDLVSLTLDELGENKWEDIVSSLEHYTAMPELMTKNKVTFQGGTEIQWQLMVDHSNQASYGGLYAVDDVNVSDQIVQPKVPWRHVKTAWAWDARELAMNRDEHQIVDLMKVRRADGMIALAEVLETKFWNTPTDATDDTNPMGAPYWIVWNSTDGFTGGAQFGSTVGNVNPTTYTRWKNYSATYTTVSKTNLFRLWRKAARQTNFKSLKQANVPSYNTGNKYAYYTDETTIGLIEELCEDQNDNLGNDLASKDGDTTFHRTPIVYVPKLNTAAASGSNPIFGINWGVFKPVFLEGWFMKEQVVKAPYQHTVVNVFVDTTHNFICRNRRLNFVIAKSDPF